MLDRGGISGISGFILPDNWYSEKKRIFETYGKKPSLWRHVRGPVTLATSIFGVENLIFLYIMMSQNCLNGSVKQFFG